MCDYNLIMDIPWDNIKNQLTIKLLSLTIDTLLKDQSFKLEISNQEPGSCYFSAKMSNKPELVIAGSIDEDDSTISMIHMKLQE